MSVRFEPRSVVLGDRTYIGVTSAMKLAAEARGEDAAYYGAVFHSLEGTGAHQAALDHLAHMFGWIPEYALPTWPEEHGDERRWHNVMHAAVKGFCEFVEQVELEPIAIEQESFSGLYQLVGHVDCYALMKYRAQRIMAIIDLKFVAAIHEEHRTQIRCYGRLDGFRDAQLGFIFQQNRTTGIWKTEPVNLTLGLHRVMEVSCAAHKYLAKKVSL